jgi:hypothetical protein
MNWLEDFLDGAKKGLKAGWAGLSWKEMQEQTKDEPAKPVEEERPKSNITMEEFWNFGKNKDTKQS